MSTRVRLMSEDRNFGSTLTVELSNNKHNVRLQTK